MKTSDSITKISTALVEFHKDVPVFGKNKEVKSSKYTFMYADLDTILESIRGPLAKHGLFHTNGMEVIEGAVYQVTRLVHSSGEWMESVFPIQNAATASPQTVGASITYGKRYNILGLTGLTADEDTDGQQEQEKPKTKVKEADPRSEEMRELYRSLNETITSNVDDLDALRKAWNARMPEYKKLKAFNETAAEQIAVRYDSAVNNLAGEK